MEINQILEAERLSKMLDNEHKELKQQQLKDSISENINFNSQLSNTKAQNMRISSNLIDFKHRAEVFRNWNKQACKEAKKAFKQGNNKLKSEFIELIAEYSRKGYPNYDAKCIILS